MMKMKVCTVVHCDSFEYYLGTELWKVCVCLSVMSIKHEVME